MRVAVLVPVVVAVVWTGRRRRPVGADAVRPDRYWQWLAVWVGLIAAATLWELAALFSSPRDDHPTLSSIADDVMGTHPGRAATFALWLVVGWLLFVRPVERRA
jgi:hypothetical protein